MTQHAATNFGHLLGHDPQLVRLGVLAERYFADDPNTSLIKLRQFGELLAQLIAAKVGIYTSCDEAQYDLLRRLQENQILPREIAQLFGEVRREGNAATHERKGDHRTALSALRVSWQLGVWFHRTFADKTFKSGAFAPPAPPAKKSDETAELRKELAALRAAHDEAASKLNEAASKLTMTEAELQQAKQEQALWEQMATEAEAKAADARKAAELQATQQLSLAMPKATLAAFVTAARTAADQVELSEADTRKLIDAQLCEAGWTADTVRLSYAKGARPQRGRHLAIAEWPTANGPADYVLFVGLMPMAVVEAKRRNKNVSATLQQAKRYSRGFEVTADLLTPGGPWVSGSGASPGDFRIPFAFSTNGRPYLRQIETLSGIWFCDLRDPDNHGHALDGWYTPEGLKEKLKQETKLAHAKLQDEPFNFGFPLRDYQKKAIHAVEEAIGSGQREILLAMATGTGKTKTCIALLYRLLKVGRFRRILFVVDRSALGDQAASAFKDTRMENLQTFADAFGIKEIDQPEPETATAVHIATVQGLVKRVLFAPQGTPPPSVDQYDCIIVDECHRGYLLDRELSEVEFGFRGFEDYISKYRRVLDYFDAVKVGLTATPALHTTEIFGPPVFVYGYREAVIDEFLVDHEPPYVIHTQLSRDGIVWQAGEDVPVYNPKVTQLELFRTPDEIRIEVEGFNKQVITKSFNEVVCEVLANELDPSSKQKTLIFCATDLHAEIVVDLLKKAFAKRYGSVEDDAVMKITGAADRPLQLIKRFKNELTPNVAVTVDLLTTGIDVPEICNIVFLRRVSSRILFDQMLGRATRLCSDIGKETFRIFDAVRIYEALSDLTAMKPVVVNPKLSFVQLAEELTRVKEEDGQQLVREQLIAKLQRKKRHLSERQEAEFEAHAGMSPKAFVEKLKAMPLSEVAAWFTSNAGLGEILDRKEGERPPTLVYTGTDGLVSIDRGYGKAQKPGDFLDEFADFIRTEQNRIPALITVLTRPRDLTRKQLRELALALDREGFSEAKLGSAWKETTNQDVAARIVGYIRRAAIGDPLISYEQRVETALQKILAKKRWSTPQRDWLTRIAAQTKANTVVDRAALDDPELIFKREGGGFERLNRIFDGGLQEVLETFNDSLWSATG
jgi:type I restriction enzyme R subunit